MDQLQLALAVMYLGSSRDEMANANVYLQQFQKSPEAWTLIHQILALPGTYSLQTQLFAAQTLRTKITYDLNQVPEGDLAKLKDSVFEFVVNYSLSGDKVVRTQLLVALAQLALQYLRWDNAMNEVISKLLALLELVPTLLEFLKVLPEELSDVKSTTLTDEEFDHQTKVLINDQVEAVVGILSDLTQKNPSNQPVSVLILDAFNLWIKECPVELIITVTPLINLVFQSLIDDTTFEKSVDCLTTILRETRDVQNESLVNSLYDLLLQLNQYFFGSHREKLEDPETAELITRLYVEAAELWYVLVAKNPKHFMPLVKILLECTKFELDLDVVKYTFPFWNDLKLLLTLAKFEECRAAYVPIYCELIEILIKQLTYPLGDDENNLFDGDKETEDKFKEFRYDMGDVLKDCCAVVGSTKALLIPFEKIQTILNSNDPSTKRWQYLESSLFSLRTMAKEVPLTEKLILPSIMSYLVQLPEHPKVRYAATLVLGRYTEWTAKNPQYLEPQLNYIIKGFELSDMGKEIAVAASHALMYFCQDCSKLLLNYLEQLYHVYDQVRDKIDHKSQCELARGLGFVIGEVPPESQYHMLEMFLKPTLEELGQQITNESTCDKLEILEQYVTTLELKLFEAPTNEVARFYMEKVWPVVVSSLTRLGTSPEVGYQACLVINRATRSFSTYLLPILPDLASVLHQGFVLTHQGSYLWALGGIIREFGDEYCEQDTRQAVYDFSLGQCLNFITYVASTPMSQHPDDVDDFFLMVSDILMFFPEKFMANGELVALMIKVLEVAVQTVSENSPLVKCLHFLIDWVLWGLPHPPVLFFGGDTDTIRAQVKLVLLVGGEQLLRVILNGIIFTFPKDIIQDANDILLKILTVAEGDVAYNWLRLAVANLPNANGKDVEKLLGTVQVAIANRDNRRIRSALKDFVTWYTRKNVTPRMQF